MTELRKRLQPQRMILTHIGHDLDVWLQQGSLPEGMEVGHDGMLLSV